jgi:5-methyltetrahydrofolate--homocysteine methyltransferase
MQGLDSLREAVIKGQASKAKALTEAALDEAWTPCDIVDQGLIAGMKLVSDRFRNGGMYVPDVLIASRAVHAGMHVLRPFLIKSGAKLPDRVIVGTVAGDLHDLGKNLVVMMLRGKGLDVIDLGIDVEPEEFVQAVVDHKPRLLGMSALLTTTMPVMAATVQALCLKGLRQQVKVMIGGGPVTKEYARVIKADGYAPDFRQAAEEAMRLLGYLPAG